MSHNRLVKKTEVFGGGEPKSVYPPNPFPVRGGAGLFFRATILP